jgi:hypothetical protein
MVDLNRRDIGLERSPSPLSLLASLMESPGSEDNTSVGSQDTIIGRSYSPSPRRRLFVQPRDYLESMEPTSNLLDLSRRESMFGRRTPGWENSLNTEWRSRTGIARWIGIEYVYWLLPESSRIFPVTFSFDIMETCEEFMQTAFNRLLWSEKFMSSGVLLEQGNLVELGSSAEWTRTLRIHAPNFGVGTQVRDELLLMNFEAVSISPIYLDGSIDILSELKLKAEVRR